jgi:hypothetical protein
MEMNFKKGLQQLSTFHANYYAISLAISNFLGTEFQKLTYGVQVHKAYNIYFYRLLLILKTIAAIMTVVQADFLHEGKRSTVKFERLNFTGICLPAYSLKVQSY